MRALIASLILTLGLAAAQAHEQRVGPRGGALVDAGTYHVELVTKDKAVEIFVSDQNDKPLAASASRRWRSSRSPENPCALRSSPRRMAESSWARHRSRSRRA